MTETRGAALVTGASAGLGLELARLFAKDGHGLVLVARRREKLDELALELSKAHGTKCDVVPADLADHEAPASVFDQVSRLGVQVEFLVNNAGFGSNGAFAGLDPKRELDMIEVNVTALVHLTRLFLPDMIARGRGRILNVGSTAGFVAGPYMATYYASKAFVNSFTEALSYELGGTGVTATAFCPGATATEFAAVAKTEKSKLFQSGVAGSAEVALAGYRAMLAGKTLAVPGLRNKLVTLAPRFVPRRLARAITARLNRS